MDNNLQTNENEILQDDLVPENLDKADGTESEDLDLDKQVEDLKLELLTQKNTALRALADLDNYRKRMLKEKEELRTWALSSLMEALLSVIDNLELGLQGAQASQASEGFLKGFQMVYEQLLSTLKSHGLSLIEANEGVFDPNTQECVAHINHEQVPENHIVQVVRKGYMIKEKLLRPASVVVSNGMGSNSDLV